MQLILDAETTIDVESNMSAINQDSLDEKFANIIIDHFSKDPFDNDNIEAHDNIIDDRKEKENENENGEISKTITSNIILSDDNDGKNLNDCSSENSDKNLNDNTRSDNTAENIETEISENNDVSTNQDHDSESRNEILVKENPCLPEEPTNILDNEIIQLESNLSESSDIVKDDPSNKDIIIFDEELNESLIENDQIDKLDNIVKTEFTNECQISNTSEKDNEERNIYNTEIAKSQVDESEKSGCCVPSSMDCDATSEENIIDEESVAFSEHEDIAVKEEEDAESQHDSQMIGSHSPSSCADNTNEDNDINEPNKEEQFLETESITTENIIEKIDEEIDEMKSDETKEDKTYTFKSIGEEKKVAEKNKSSLICKLSNTLNILSDDEDEQIEDPQNIEKPSSNDKERVSFEDDDDDDIMLIDEDTNSNVVNDSANVDKTDLEHVDKTDLEHVDKTDLEQGDTEMTCNVENSNEAIVAVDTKNETATETIEVNVEKNESDTKNNDYNVNVKPLLPSNFLKTCKKNLADMTRDDLEEFCILKIVESVVDRSNLGDIKTQLKSLALAVEEHKKKAMMLTKQNRDLQVVLKSVQEEQKKSSVFPITPLKITRSVGMQVLMTDKPSGKRKSIQAVNPTSTSNYTLTFADKSIRNNTNQKTQKSNTNIQQIPVPRLVPAANNTATKANTMLQSNTNNSVKPQQLNNSLPNGIRNSPPAQKPEKRPRIQSVTVDLTDDEPPSKMTSRSSPAPPVRLVPPQNLMAPQRPPFVPNINSPRKVYIPISGPQAQNVRPGQTIMLKSVPPNPGLRQRGPPLNNMAKMPPNTIRMNRVQSNRHPAPLPDALKQYQPPNWKALPPAPDLKLSKVENGIVISWKIEGYQDDSYEDIASYQLYAYQETNSPPSTALWKKIGDVKALPLPMACTLTQFMAGYKYYFAVRAVDVKSRLGPFSLPGSILLLNKM